MNKAKWRWARTILRCVPSGLLAVVAVIALGCGQGSVTPVTGSASGVSPSTSLSTSASTLASTAPSTSASTSMVSSTTSALPEPTTTTETQPTAEPSAVADVFARLATIVQPLTVYTPGEVPEGVTVAKSWLPVIDSTDPGSYTGPRRANPYVVGTGADAEAQVVLQLGKGWLVVIENFHGDVGDVSGTRVGDVDGKPAALFQVNGGELVQWSTDGLWYGVFGRAVSRDAIVAVALGMVKVLPESP